MDDSVYLGVWTNWSRGSVFGPTLTTTKVYGNLLIAFTAVFIGFVASRFWRILCLCLHRLYSTPKPRDTMHHQRQVILRNSTAPEASLWNIVQMLWAWRSARSTRLLSLLPTILLAITTIAAFTAAGGFSSSISTAVGDEVLIRSPDCGIISTPNQTVEDQTIIDTYLAERLNDAENYAQQCYEASTTSAMGCNKFVVSHLPTALANNSASCPFQQRICRNQHSNLRLDTGYVDGNSALGLNTPNDQSFAWRYVLHCAPLETEGYTTHVVEQGRGMVSYSLSKINNGQVLKGDGTPIPELTRLDGDTMIVFLSGNGVHFSQRMDDDWYRATESDGSIWDSEDAGYLPAYNPSVAASALGCVEQWQWCNSALPGERGCGPLASGIDSLYGAAPLFNVSNKDLDPDRPSVPEAPGTRLIWSFLTTSANPNFLSTVIAQLGAKSLASQSRLLSGVQHPLPINQWQLDVTRWWNIILASVQQSWLASVISTAQGSNDTEFRPLLSPPLNNEEKKLCNSQKIRSLAHTSFSLFGLLFTFTTGALIIGWLYRRRQYQPYAQLEWISNTSLQLHRLAHEELGISEWSNCTDEVPTANLDVPLPGLDLTDPNHPILNQKKNSYTTEQPQEADNNIEQAAALDFPGSQPSSGTIHDSSAANTQQETERESSPGVTEGFPEDETTNNNNTERISQDTPQDYEHNSHQHHRVSGAMD
ncbi:hypothetical protein F5Y19DRAFT_483195 [Xylariaceae sp. FL1651]|nr:hypothetical protein F5Y19DRAFT_483195 [Xylariaceae sp. FL1651]